jgi:hypothetical protein
MEKPQAPRFSEMSSQPYGTETISPLNGSLPLPSHRDTLSPWEKENLHSELRDHGDTAGRISMMML